MVGLMAHDRIVCFAVESSWQAFDYYRQAAFPRLPGAFGRISVAHWNNAAIVKVDRGIL